MDCEALTAEKRVHFARASPETFGASSPARKRESLHSSFRVPCLSLRCCCCCKATTCELSHRFLTGKAEVTYFSNSYTRAYVLVRSGLRRNGISESLDTYCWFLLLHLARYFNGISVFQRFRRFTVSSCYIKVSYNEANCTYCTAMYMYI